MDTRRTNFTELNAEIDGPIRAHEARQEAIRIRLHTWQDAEQRAGRNVSTEPPSEVADALANSRRTAQRDLDAIFARVSSALDAEHEARAATLAEKAEAFMNDLADFRCFERERNAFAARCGQPAHPPIVPKELAIDPVHVEAIRDRARRIFHPPPTPAPRREAKDNRLVLDALGA